MPGMSLLARGSPEIRARRRNPRAAFVPPKLGKPAMPAIIGTNGLYLKGSIPSMPPLQPSSVNALLPGPEVIGRPRHHLSAEGAL